MGTIAVQDFLLRLLLSSYLCICCLYFTDSYSTIVAISMLHDDDDDGVVLCLVLSSLVFVLSLRFVLFFYVFCLFGSCLILTFSDLVCAMVSFAK